MIRLIVATSFVVSTGAYAAHVEEHGKVQGHSAQHAPAKTKASDEDSDNAKNPALPGNEQGKGQETGGPARGRIPN